MPPPPPSLDRKAVRHPSRETGPDLRATCHVPHVVISTMRCGAVQSAPGLGAYNLAAAAAAAPCTLLVGTALQALPMQLCRLSMQQDAPTMHWHGLHRRRRCHQVQRFGVPQLTCNTRKFLLGWALTYVLTARSRGGSTCGSLDWLMGATYSGTSEVTLWTSRGCSLQACTPPCARHGDRAATGTLWQRPTTHGRLGLSAYHGVSLLWHKPLHACLAPTCLTTQVAPPSHHP